MKWLDRLITWLKSLNTPIIRIVRRFDDRIYHFYAEYTNREEAEAKVKLLIGQGKKRNYVVIRIGSRIGNGKFIIYFEEKTA